MQATKSTIATVSALLALAALTSVPASAGESSGSTATLEEVIVTAAKREDSLQKTALSITAITGETINEGGRNDVVDVLKDVPGVTLNNGPLGNYQINIRGVAGASLPGFDGDPGASVNLDGAYNSAYVGGPSQLSFYDVAQVEVLRGPQGTLYGRNAQSGAVNMVTGNPGKEFDITGTAEAGNYDLRRFAGAINVPLNNAWAARFAFTDIYRKGYFTSGGGGVDGSSGRLKLQYDTGSAFRLLLGTEYSKTGGRVGVGGMGAGIASWGLNEPTVDPYDDVTKNGGLSGTIPGSFQNNRYAKNWVQLDWDSRIGTFTFVPSHVNIRNTWTTFTLLNMAAPGVYGALPNVATGNQDTAELRLTSSPDSRVGWIVGAFYLKADNTTVATAFMGNAFSNNTVSVNAKSSAIFGQATYPLSETMRLIGGLRSTKDEKSYFASNPTNAGLPAGTPGSGGGDWSRVDYKIGLEKDLSPSSLLYAHVATGYRPGGVTTGSASVVGGPNGTLVPNRNLITKPEYLTALEVGTKNQFLGDRLRVNAGAFYYDYKDRQYTYFTTQATIGVPCPNGQLPLLFGADVVCLIELNANKVRMIGAELETLWVITPQDHLSLGVSLLQSKGAERQLVQLANPNPVTNPLNANNIIREYNIDINGKTLPNSPKLMWNLSYDHDFNMLWGSISPRVDLRYQSETYLQAFQYLLDVTNVAAGFREGNKYIQKGRTIVDYSLNFKSSSGKFTVNAYMKNAGEELYKTITDGNVTTAGTPRTYGVVLNVHR